MKRHTLLPIVVVALAACDRITPSGPDANGQVAISAGSSFSAASSERDDRRKGADLCVAVTATTIVIVKNTRLTCDIKCETTTTPCIQFGAPGIKLDLNGHRVWGPAEPPVNCETTTTFLPADGIASFAHSTSYLPSELLQRCLVGGQREGKPR
jgi:hypothetical protein